MIFQLVNDATNIQMAPILQAKNDIILT